MLNPQVAVQKPPQSGEFEPRKHHQVELLSKNVEAAAASCSENCSKLIGSRQSAAERPSCSHREADRCLQGRIILDYSRGLKISAASLPPSGQHQESSRLTCPGARGRNLGSACAFIHIRASLRVETLISSSETLQDAESAPPSRSLHAR